MVDVGLIPTVSPEGVLTTLEEGNVTITAVMGSASGTASLAVFKNPIASIQITPTTATLLPGASVTLKAVALDAEGRKVPVRSFSWSSSDSTVATVSNNGQVNGKRKGTAIISASAGELRLGDRYCG